MMLASSLSASAKKKQPKKRKKIRGSISVQIQHSSNSFFWQFYTITGWLRTIANNRFFELPISDLIIFYFRLFNALSIQLMVNLIDWIEGRIVEATALPTGLQPLPTTHAVVMPAAVFINIFNKLASMVLRYGVPTY